MAQAGRLRPPHIAPREGKKRERPPGPENPQTAKRLVWAERFPQPPAAPHKESCKKGGRIKSALPLCEAAGRHTQAILRAVATLILPPLVVAHIVILCGAAVGGDWRHGVPPRRFWTFGEKAKKSGAASRRPRPLCAGKFCLSPPVDIGRRVR